MTRRATRVRDGGLALASLVFVVASFVYVVAQPTGPARIAFDATLGLCWAALAVDYVVSCARADHRGAWFATHLVDLATLVLPWARPIALVRVALSIALVRRRLGPSLRGKVGVYAATSTLLLIVTASVAELSLEREAPGASITNFGDALWWSVTTMATVSGGDYVPVTLGGRLVAVVLMAGGFALLGVVSASLSSWLLQRAGAGPGKAEEPGP